ncbi:tRNA pseudouridine(38-40) synthase TruA [Faecalicoccus pleomorphus]|uniref:tRNA pseudouridine(38-40) synthase TruA n=1 Tax=Faecalicoccus pleomorphus TaxID=1323 RepID=UPI00196058A3|nr:tRNA pseudouridine(38-40) synthase TruA [Faecalicoccus pleomorphus]MBM6766242.1 tRNA pseudouridine(38-40) synthase TruA [Faecalicoccus pleomorphus]
MIIKCTVAYDGYNYAGWQKQENALGIQTIIEEALEKIQKKPVEIVASGRTDAQVHALGQVFHFQSAMDMQPWQYVKAMNALLPQDIRIQSAEIMADDFHARFSCKSKQYAYIATYDVTDPFAYRYKAPLYQKLDMEKMLEAATYLIGKHDFTSFSSSRIDPRKPRIKTIRRIEIENADKDVHFLFEGNGFLRYQVRMMTGTLIEVGKQKIQPLDVQHMLLEKNKEVCRYNAPPQGLYLMKVRY